MEWKYAFVPGADGEGRPVLSLLGKCTRVFTMGATAPSEDHEDILTSDRYSDPQAPRVSEVIAESDLVPYKPFTDVVVTGYACAPQGRQAHYMDCAVRVGPLMKTVRVHGRRVATFRRIGVPRISSPDPLERLPLGYANAYGGVALAKDGITYAFAPNPIGRGFLLKGGPRQEELLMPAQEDPSCPLSGDDLLCDDPSDWSSLPQPASLGWTRRDSHPRYTYASPFAAAGANTAVPVVIPGDPRFHQGASPGLYGGPLAGDETVRITYMHPDHTTFEFPLPGSRPVMTLDIGDGPVELDPALQTVVVDMDRQILTLLWRGCLAYGGLEVLEQVPWIRCTVDDR